MITQKSYREFSYKHGVVTCFYLIPFEITPDITAGWARSRSSVSGEEIKVRGAGCLSWIKSVLPANVQGETANVRFRSA